MKRPRIYGSEAKCRTALARYISDAEELVDRAVGVRNRIAALPPLPKRKQRSSPGPFGLSWVPSSEDYRPMLIEGEWAKEVERWRDRARTGMRRYLQEGFVPLLPVLADGPPPDAERRYRIGLDNGEPWLTDALGELKALQAVLGVRREVAAAVTAPARFEELHASGLLSERVISDLAREMLSPSSPRQLAAAIGAAKELTEATLRAALERLGESPRRSDDLRVLMRKWRNGIGRQAPPDPEGEAALDKAQAAVANVVTFLAEWRNAYGRGHGRPKYPPGLTKRHARLAADAAETCVRFIVTTMDDLELLPP